MVPGREVIHYAWACRGRGNWDSGLLVAVYSAKVGLCMVAKGKGGVAKGKGGRSGKVVSKDGVKGASTGVFAASSKDCSLCWRLV